MINLENQTVFVTGASRGAGAGIARQIADRVADEMTFPGEIKVTVLRETRAVEIAR